MNLLYDRRRVIIVTTFGSSALALLSILTSNDPIQNIYYMDELAFLVYLCFYL